MCKERRGQPIGGPSAPSWGGKGKRSGGAHINPRELGIYVGRSCDDFRGISAC